MNMTQIQRQILSLYDQAQNDWINLQRFYKADQKLKRNHNKIIQHWKKCMVNIEVKPQ